MFVYGRLIRFLSSLTARPAYPVPVDRAPLCPQSLTVLSAAGCTGCPAINSHRLPSQPDSDFHLFSRHARRCRISHYDDAMASLPRQPLAALASPTVGTLAKGVRPDREILWKFDRGRFPKHEIHLTFTREVCSTVYLALTYMFLIDSSSRYFEVFETFQVSTLQRILHIAVFSETGRFQAHENRVDSKSRELHAYKYMIRRPPLDSLSQPGYSHSSSRAFIEICARTSARRMFPEQKYVIPGSST